MPCFLKNLPPLGYTFHLRVAMIIAPKTQYSCILCTQKPRKRIHAREALLETEAIYLRHPSNIGYLLANLAEEYPHYAIMRVRC